MDNDDLLQRLELEKRARKHAEAELESKSLELFKANLKLAQQSEDFEETLKQRTEHLQKTLYENRSASLLKHQFISNISHELRTPLNGILGTLQLLLERPKDQEQKKLVGHALISAERLKVLISDMLDMSRLERGEIKLDEYEFNIGALARELGENFGQQASAKGVDLFLHGLAKSDLQVIADPVRLRQVLFSLVENAVKFTEHGRIDVTIGVRDLDGEQVSLYIAVSDTGIGIEEDKIDAIFDQFSQGDSSPSRRFQGAGLGLATASQLLEMMGSRLQVISELGKGSCFWFAIPLRHDVSLLAKPEGAKVMMVAPYDGDRSFTVKDMASAGMDVTVMNDSQAMLSGLEDPDANFDLILLDERISTQDKLLLEQYFPRVWSQRTALLCLSKKQALKQAIAHKFVSVIERPLEMKSLDALLALLCEAGEVWEDVSPLVVPEKYTRSEELADMSDVDFHRDSKWRGKVLLVEDNRLNALIAIEMLKSLGVEHHWVENGLEAIEAMKDQLFELILMDCQMPVMDGYEATRRIRAGEAGASNRLIPIIALTADNPSQGLHSFMKCDMNGWISKPIESSRLLVEMQHHLLRKEFVGDYSFEAKLSTNPALANALLKHWQQTLLQLSDEYSNGAFDEKLERSEPALALLVEIADAFELPGTLNTIQSFLVERNHDELPHVFDSTMTEIQQHIKSKLHALAEAS